MTGREAVATGARSRRPGGVPEAPSGATAVADPVARVELAAGLGSVAVGVAVLTAAVGAVDLVLSPPSVRWALVASSAAASVIIGLLGVWHLRRGFSSRALPHVAGLGVIVCTATTIAQLALTGDPAESVYVMLTILGAAPLLPLRRWLSAAAVLAAAGYAAVAAQQWPEPPWPQFAVALAVSVALAHMLHGVRSRGQAQLQLLTDALSRQARVDPLTGLLNRLGLAAAGSELLPAGEGEGGLVLGVVCVDVDGFKAVNDELGHAAGDAVLVEVANRLSSLVGADDLVARLGGDEFVVLLPGTGSDAVEVAAHRVRIQLRGTAGALALPWAVSAGSASGVVRDTAGVEQLLRSADLRMYDDKQVRRRARGPGPVAGAPDRRGTDGERRLEGPGRRR